MPPASASAVNNNSSNNNNAAAAKAEREERLRAALKAFVLKEHQRKKEEIEAKEEEERVRKEREERERQNDATLEETRGKMSKLDQKIKDLQNQKQQLFLQLKKVVNEDELRKKQQQKENEMFALQAQQVNVPQPQVFIPPVRMQHHQMPIMPKPVGNQPVKRARSPSPPQHQSYYKNTAYGQPKHDDGRRGADYPRVVWNKPPTQYQAPGALFYQTTGNAPPQQPPPDARSQTIIYPAYGVQLRQGYHLELQPSGSGPVSKADQSQPPKPTQVYHISLDVPPISQSGAVSSVPPGVQSQKPQVTMEKITDRYHADVKHDGPPGHGPPHALTESVVYTPLIQGMPLHPNVMQLGGNLGQNPKSAASITQGYAPGRSAAAAVAAHEQHMARQQQMMQGQPGQQQQQQMNYAHRMF